jgi:hypothetical protein
MTTRLRVAFPTVIGAISLALVIWAIYNDHVIASMGMGWDMGAPLWPYQTPQILLYVLNYPAHYIAQPMANHLGLVSPQHYALVFPTTLLWWWFVGSRVDCGLVVPVSKGRPIILLILLTLAAVLLWGATIVLYDGFRWWFQYGGESLNISILILLEKLAPAIWGLALGLFVAIAAKRIATPLR